MKKILTIFLSAVTLGLTSCDMEKYPYDALQDKDALETMQDFTNARIGLYSTYRTITTGSHVLAQEIQADAFNAVLGFSNTYGDAYRWTFESTSSTIEAIWGNYYTAIGRSNYIIDGAEKALVASTLTEKEKASVKVFEGEAYFTRAFSYFCLAQLFCKDFNPTTAGSDLGLPLQLIYAPTTDAGTFPGRSTLEATYKQIQDDLKKAEDRIVLAPAARSAYLTTDAVSAFKARLALQMDNYDLAATTAQALTEKTTYKLINNLVAYADMWKHDTGTEAIWQIAMTNKDEAGSQTGVYFIGLKKADDKDYIPSGDLLNLYDSDNDIRFATYFGTYTLTVASGASGDIYFFNKYPGNNNISTSSGSEFTNQSKVFRISEMYLIAAEAYAKKNDLINGSKYLNDLKAMRIAGYTGTTYSNPDALFNEIKSERFRELVGEGYRLMDLKRWGMGVKRTESQNESLILFPGQATTDKLDKRFDDNRMLWPIPKAEIDANPQIKSQQNPGY